MGRLIPINTTAEGLCPTITVRYAQGFALSAALYKSALFGEFGGNVRLAIVAVYED